MMRGLVSATRSRAKRLRAGSVDGGASLMRSPRRGTRRRATRRAIAVAARGAVATRRGPPRDAREVRQRERRDPDAHAGRLVQRAQHGGRCRQHHRRRDAICSTPSASAIARARRATARLAALAKTRTASAEEWSTSRNASMRCVSCTCCAPPPAVGIRAAEREARHATAAPGILAVSPPMHHDEQRQRRGDARAARASCATRRADARRAPPRPPARIDASPPGGEQRIATSLVRDASPTAGCRASP